MGNKNTVTTKIKGAMAADDIYSLVMENAVIIKVNMCQLKDWLWPCEAIHNVEERYLDVLKNEIKTFKKIFIQWVGSFDKERDLPDEWHLFNDPVISRMTTSHLVPVIFRTILTRTRICNVMYFDVLFFVNQCVATFICFSSY